MEDISVPTDAFLLYFCMNTSSIGNQLMSGVMMLVQESPILYAICVNSGLYPRVMNMGTNMGAMMAHLAEAEPRNRSIMQTSITKPMARGMPVI